MNMKTLLALSIATALTACANADQLSILDKNEIASSSALAAPNAASEPVAASESTAQNTHTESYVCNNGMTVHTRYQEAGEENAKVNLRVDALNASAILTEAVSGSGVRYVGQLGTHQAEWHEKNGEAAFAFSDTQGKNVETVCRITH